MSNLQHEYLDKLHIDQTSVSIYLLNGIKLSGVISAFDDGTVILRDSKNVTEQLIYKHAISTIVPNNK